MVPAEQYAAALTELAKEEQTLELRNGLEMLKAHYRSSGRLISATRLAEAVGMGDSGPGVGNSQYGKLAHRIADLLGIKPTQTYDDGNPIWTYTLGNAHQFKDRFGHFQWIMRPELAQAMEQVGMVEPVTYHDALDDLAAKHEIVMSLDEKHRMTYTKARVGQGQFRDNLVNYWRGCAVTGCKQLDLLIASHIKPWRDCEVHEATDMPNGLLLSPGLDKAFDYGYITFELDGKIRLSPQLKPETAAVLGIHPEMRIEKGLTDRHTQYLEHNHSKVFRKTA
ncbi:HNH endonuclease [Stutzerimonas stutzeri]|nr:HNH endonuclease [Stutzerimonas stutzeri]